MSKKTMTPGTISILSVFNQNDKRWGEDLYLSNMLTAEESNRLITNLAKNSMVKVSSFDGLRVLASAKLREIECLFNSTSWRDINQHGKLASASVLCGLLANAQNASDISYLLCQDSIFADFLLDGKDGILNDVVDAIKNILGGALFDLTCEESTESLCRVSLNDLGF